jgi:hypothetical protein
MKGVVQGLGLRPGDDYEGSQKNEEERKARRGLEGGTRSGKKGYKSGYRFRE